MPEEQRAGYRLVERVGGTELTEIHKGEHRLIAGRFRAVKIPRAASKDGEQPTGGDVPLVFSSESVQTAFVVLCNSAAKVAQELDAARAEDLPAAQQIAFIDAVHNEGEQPYIITEWVEGASLKERIAKGGIGVAQAVEIIAAALQTLRFAHTRGLVHGNVKPSNLLLQADKLYRIVDFGGNDLAAGFPLRPSVLPYLSPEQLDPSLRIGGTLDGRTDLFSLSAVLYEMLTGRKVPRVLAEEWLPSRLNRQLPVAYDGLIMKGLETDPQKRYRDASAMLQALYEVAGVVLPRSPGNVVARVFSAVTRGLMPTQQEADRPPNVVAPPPRTAGEERGNRADGAVMVWVPGGDLRMGSEDLKPYKAPPCEVKVKGFWIYKYPVTQELFLKYLNELNLTQKPRIRPPALFQMGSSFDNESGPAVTDEFRVSSELRNVAAAGLQWSEAKAYCTHVGARLPTEAEWEWVARGPEGRRYPWGESWEAGRANGIAGKEDAPRAVASVSAHPSGGSWCGAFDLVGNVFEWCSSLYQDYPYVVDDGREEPEADGLRVLRGGSAATRVDRVAMGAFRFYPQYTLGRNVFDTSLTGVRPVVDDEA